METVECVVWCLAAIWCMLGPLVANDYDRDYLGLNDKENENDR